MHESLLLDQTREILLLVDPLTLAICEVSKPSLRRLGYTLDDLIGRPITDIECALSDLFYWDEVRQSGNANVTDTECSYLCSNGDILLASKTVLRIERDGASWLVIRAEPLAPRQQAENELASISSRLQATLEATSEGILLLDRAGKILNMNQCFSRMWGFPDAMLARRVDEEAFAFMASFFTDPQAYQRDLAAIHLDSDLESFDTLELADGRVFERRSRPARHAEQIIGRVFSFSDATERKAIEQQLLHQNARLEEECSYAPQH
jgi:PAS domain S-box-containing protein